MWDEGRDEKSVAVAATNYFNWASSEDADGAERLYEIIDTYIIPKYGDKSTNDLRFHDIEDLSNEIEDSDDAKCATTVLLKIMEGGFMPFAGDVEMRESMKNDPNSDLAQRLKMHEKRLAKELRR